MDNFKILYEIYINLHNRYLDWNEVKLIDDNIIKYYRDLTIPNNIEELSKQICIIKLNGGLGTTMGCSGPKSLLEVKANNNFLDIIIKQREKHYTNIPFYLMNSFYTHKLTLDYINNKYPFSNIKLFQQNKYPRILKSSNQPLYDSINIDHYYPPGHGDIIEALKNNRIIDELLHKNIKYIFISNIDNLGATVNFPIINDLIINNTDFAIELTKKTIDDVKGGTLIKYNNKFKMFEIAECPPDKVKEFTSIDKFKYFNTNNIYIKVSAIKELENSDYLKYVDLIVNPKKLKDGQDCIQLEYAIGSLVKFFNNIGCYLVDRDRFIPVKTNNDLNYIRSNKYILNDDHFLIHDPNNS